MELSALLSFDESDLNNEKLLHDIPYGSLLDQDILAPRLDGLDISDFYHVSDKVLGDGSYSVVYKAQRKSDGLMVAVKTISKRLLFSPEERASVKREIELHSLLHHPNIVRLLETFETRRSIHLVMELVEGLTLDQYTRRCPNRVLTEPQARNISKQVTSALLHMVEHGLVHGDIKPQNILLLNPSFAEGTTNFTVKLCDFGMTRSILKEHPKGLIGTTGYMAPEVLHHQRLSFPIDMWSFGVTLYVVLCGGHPFNHSNFTDLHFPEHPSLSNSVKDLLSKLLCENPRKRLHAEQILQHPWLHPRRVSSDI